MLSSKDGSLLGNCSEVCAEFCEIWVIHFGNRVRFFGCGSGYEKFSPPVILFSNGYFEL